MAQPKKAASPVRDLFEWLRAALPYARVSLVHCPPEKDSEVLVEVDRVEPYVRRTLVNKVRHALPTLLAEQINREGWQHDPAAVGMLVTLLRNYADELEKPFIDNTLRCATPYKCRIAKLGEDWLVQTSQRSERVKHNLASHTIYHLITSDLNGNETDMNTDMIQLIKTHWPSRKCASSETALANLVNKLRFVCGCSYGTIVSIFQAALGEDLVLGEFDEYMNHLDNARL